MGQPVSGRRGSVRKQTKAAGTRFERRVKSYLMKLGWDVFRSAGSRTCADLIAIKPGPSVLLVQCKASSVPALTPKERNELIYKSKHLNARILIICRVSTAPYALIYYAHIGDSFVEVREPQWLR